MFTMDSKVFKYTVAGILFVAGVVRLLTATVEFQYDELWTLMNFSSLGVSQILTDLSLPNNHPLNTLVLKVLSAYSTDLLVLRLGVLLCGMAVVVLTGICAKKAAFSDRNAMISAMFFTAVSAPLILYSATARGYIWQCAGLLICVLGLFNTANERSKKAPFLRRYLPEILIVAGGVIAIISVPTGIMFLMPAALGFLLFASGQQRKQKSTWISAAILALFAICYYAATFHALKSAQVWGSRIESFADWFKFISNVVPSLLPFPLALAIAAAMLFKRKYAVVFALTLLPLIAAVVTNAGQTRVYLPLNVAYAVLAGCGISEILKTGKNGSKMLALLLTLSAAAWGWEPEFMPERPAELWHNVVKATPQETLPVLRSTSGFPLAANAPDSIAEFRNRAASTGKNKLLLLNVKNGEINGADGTYSEKTLQLDLTGTPVPRFNGFEYNLTRISQEELPQSGNRWMLGVYFGDPGNLRELSALASTLTLNIFISTPPQDGTALPLRLFVFRKENHHLLPAGCDLYLISGETAQ